MGDLDRIFGYLASNFGGTYLRKYSDEVTSKVNRLAQNPEIGMQIDKTNRRYRLDKHNYLVYSTTSNGILVEAVLPYKQLREGFGSK